ncbi:MAG: LysR family transcriptional regulator [Janthinobacterium lividum]
MNMGLVDLNLLRVFLAIWENRSLTTAADQLGLTQPAVSHALRRLRLHFGDPLFTRGPTGMDPTAVATRLHVPLEEAMRAIRIATQPHGSFDPASATLTFRLSMSDMSEFYFLPALLAHTARHAPGIGFDVIPLLADGIGPALRGGQLDLALGYFPDLGNDCSGTKMFEDEHVCLVRTGHPVAARLPLGPDDMRALRYIRASKDPTGHRRVDKWLEDLGIARQVALSLPHFTVAPDIIRQTDLAMIFPRRIAQLFNRDEGFALLPLPVPLPPIEVSIHGHHRFADDAGLQWLRATVMSLFADPDDPDDPATPRATAIRDSR